MPYHVRRQIRSAIVAALNGLPSTGGNCFDSRVYPLEDTELPALLVFVGDENFDAETFIGPPMQVGRRLQIAVRIIVKATTDLDDELDAVCADVERALADPVAQLVAISETMTIRPIRIPEPTLVGTAEKPTGEMTVEFEVSYSTAVNAPDVAL